MSAQRAYEVGLVTEVVPHEKLMDRARELAAMICENAPIAVWATKMGIVQGLGLPVAQAEEIAAGYLEVSEQTEDYHEGGQNDFVHKLPTAGSVPNLVLKRGITRSSELWTWFAQYLDEGTVTPKDGQVELLSHEDGEDAAVRVWKFTAGYPVKWTGPELNAMSAGVAFETLELVHRGIRLVEQ